MRSHHDQTFRVSKYSSFVANYGVSWATASPPQSSVIEKARARTPSVSGSSRCISALPATQVAPFCNLPYVAEILGKWIEGGA